MTPQARPRSGSSSSRGKRATVGGDDNSASRGLQLRRGSSTNQLTVVLPSDRNEFQPPASPHLVMSSDGLLHVATVPKVGGRCQPRPTLCCTAQAHLQECLRVSNVWQDAPRTPGGDVDVVLEAARSASRKPAKSSRAYQLPNKLVPNDGYVSRGAHGMLRCASLHRAGGRRVARASIFNRQKRAAQAHLQRQAASVGTQPCRLQQFPCLCAHSLLRVRAGSTALRKKAASSSGLRRGR